MKPEELAELERLLAAATVEIDPWPSHCRTCLYSEPGSISYECDDCKRRRSQIQARNHAIEILKFRLLDNAPALLAAAREAAALRALVEEVADEGCESASEQSIRGFPPPYKKCSEFTRNAGWCLSCRARAALNPPTD